LIYSINSKILLKNGMDEKLLVLAKAAFDQTYKVKNMGLNSPQCFHLELGFHFKFLLVLGDCVLEILSKKKTKIECKKILYLYC